MVLFGCRFPVARQRAAATIEKGAAMYAASDTLVFRSWKEMSEPSRGMVRLQLVLLIRSSLGPGVHSFDSPEDMFNAIGIKHLTTGEVKCMDEGYGPKLFAQELKEHLAMSYHSFGRLVRSMGDVRIEQRNHAAVAREGASRLRLIVS